MKYKNLTLIGTSHIAKQSMDEVKTFIEKEKPDIIALELDKKRFVAIQQKKQPKIRFYDIRTVGLKGFLFSLIGAWLEKKLGEYVGVKPGSEMLLAIRLAKKHALQIALIDQDIEITLKKLTKQLTWKERWNFLMDILKAVILRKKDVDFDLAKVPSKKVIDKLMSKVKTRYPTIYKVLVVERNNIMGNNLYSLMERNDNKKILAIVGAGHEEDILEALKRPLISYKFAIS